MKCSMLVFGKNVANATTMIDYYVPLPPNIKFVKIKPLTFIEKFYT